MFQHQYTLLHIKDNVLNDHLLLFKGRCNVHWEVIWDRYLSVDRTKLLHSLETGC